MTKPKPSAAQQAAELRSIELLPYDEALRQTDDLLRTMLNSPPDPHISKPQAKPKKRSK
jgi:hypothetical protein